MDLLLLMADRIAPNNSESVSEALWRRDERWSVVVVVAVAGCDAFCFVLMLIRLEQQTAPCKLEQCDTQARGSAAR